MVSEARKSGEETQPEAAADSGLGDSRESCSHLEFGVLVAVFVALVWLCEIFGDSALKAMEIPAGRWLRAVYIAGCATLVGVVFTLRHRRAFSDEERTDFGVFGLCGLAVSEFILSAWLIWQSLEAISVSAVFSVSLAFLVFVAIDGLLLFLALSFPVRYGMRATRFLLGKS